MFGLVSQLLERTGEALAERRRRGEGFLRDLQRSAKIASVAGDLSSFRFRKLNRYTLRLTLTEGKGEFREAGRRTCAWKIVFLCS